MRTYRQRTKNSTKKIPRRSFVLITALTLVVVGAVSVLSRQRSVEKEARAYRGNPLRHKEPAANYLTRTVMGQEIQVDRETGQMKPLNAQETEKLAQALKKMVNQSTDALAQVKHSDGSVSMELDGRFQNVTVARVNNDGTVSKSCVDNPRAAAAFFGIDPKLIEGKTK